MTDLPEGWITTTVGESANFLTGFPFPSSGFSDSGIRLVRGSNVKRAALDWASDISEYWPFDDRSLRAFHLTDGDIVIAMDGALVGRSFARIRKSDLPAFLVQRVARLRGISVAQELLYQWIGSDAFVRHVDSVKTHTAIPHISPQDIRGFTLSIPSDPREQHRISGALANADALIVSLERMITKKQAIKEGVMQQLLVGKIRLPGFTGNWHPRRIGDMLSYEQPGRYLVQTSTQLDAGRVPVLTAGKTFVLGYTNETHGVYTRHPVIIFDDFTTDSKFVDFDFKAKSSAMKILSARSHVDLRFVYERMQLIKFPLGDHKRYWIAEYSGLEIDVPSYEEQKSVASVIVDCDTEISLLKRRLTKARSVKQGMIQELLSGRTRLHIEEGGE